MVDVRHPLSMPSTLVSHPSTPNYTLPPLPPTRDLVRTERDSIKASGKAGTEGLGHWIRNSVTVELGQVPPPREMAGINVNPLLAPNMGGLQYKSVPAVRQNARPSQTSLGTIATAQYTSKAPPTQEMQKIPSRPRSPTGHRDGAGSREPVRGGLAAAAAAAAENNSIVSYLQIPSSINDSKGSLADFAAQV